MNQNSQRRPEKPSGRSCHPRQAHSKSLQRSHGERLLGSSWEADRPWEASWEAPWRPLGGPLGGAWDASRIANNNPAGPSSSPQPLHNPLQPADSAEHSNTVHISNGEEAATHHQLQTTASSSRPRQAAPSEPSGPWAETATLQKVLGQEGSGRPPCNSPAGPCTRPFQWNLVPSQHLSS